MLAGAVSLTHAAALAVCLPLGSRLLACEDARAGWTNGEMLLLAIANSLRETPIDPFDAPDVQAMEQDALGEYLSRPRVAVESERG